MQQQQQMLIYDFPSSCIDKFCYLFATLMNVHLVFAILSQLKREMGNLKIRAYQLIIFRSLKSSCILVTEAKKESTSQLIVSSSHHPQKCRMSHERQSKVILAGLCTYLLVQSLGHFGQLIFKLL